MGKEIYLKLDTTNGVITIPFIGLSEVDDFTVRYDNLKELVITLIKILNLDIDLYDVENVYLSEEKYKKGFDLSCLSIKYKRDNFNEDSLMDIFCDYLEKDPKRIWKSKIRYVKTNGMLNFINTGIISKFEIKNAIKAYLNDSGEYKKKRDIYFFLKGILGDKLKIRIDATYDDDITRNTDLTNYDVEDDSYLSYLIELYRRGDYQFDEAMEQIAKSDLYELEKLLKTGGYGIVDGVSDNNNLIYKDIKMLEKCTGSSVEDLKEHRILIGRKKSNRR